VLCSFFLYPADEVFFHPGIGYRSREGAFVQTTSYLLGEERRDRKESGLLSLMSNMDNSGPLERSGVFIRRTSFDTDTGDGSSDVAAGKNPSILRLLADVYSSLGVYLGLHGISRAWLGLDFSLDLD
jgi:lipopolysaccharide assembly outer membrane protein LptD (OstA)